MPSDDGRGGRGSQSPRRGRRNVERQISRDSRDASPPPKAAKKRSHSSSSSEGEGARRGREVVKKRKGSYSSSPEAPRGDGDMGQRRVFVKKDDLKRREEEKVKNGESKVKSRSHSESEVSLFLSSFVFVCESVREKVCVFAVIAFTHKIPWRIKG
jgi:hypothetical protein